MIARLLGAVLLLAADGVVEAQEAIDPRCPSANTFSAKLITDICWGCVFPIRVAGLPLGGGTAPSDAADQTFCVCDDELGLPHPGYVTSMWQPVQLMETVRTPGCSMALHGVDLNLGSWRLQGIPKGANQDDNGGSYYNAHLYSFPLMVMLDLMVDADCSADGYMDFDIMFLSELDPTWNNDELAFFMAPEAALFANPLATLSCSADGFAAAVGEPIDNLYWCAGAWGPIYPMSGHSNYHASPPQNMSLLGARFLAALHRRGLAWRTMGNDALCRGYIDPMFPKGQYRFSVFYPVAESESNHRIGQPTLMWGEHRMIPAVGEDWLQLVWRWNDCCSTY